MTQGLNGCMIMIVDCTNVTLANEQTALIKSLSFLENKQNEINRKKANLIKSYKDESEVNVNKIEENTARLQTILTEK